jgi:hypothetical protein
VGTARDGGLTAEQITNVKIITDFQTKKQKVCWERLGRGAPW